jgi:hypothetical protein
MSSLAARAEMRRTVAAMSIIAIGALMILFAVASCAMAGTLPDPKLTPGAVLPNETAATLCAKTFTTKSVRDVPQELKNQVYARYNAKDHVGICACKQGCEVDHLVSLEIGGSNDIMNLWPQPYCGPLNAHVKDKLENKLHALVCANKITLDEAQTAIRTDWVAAYKKYMGMK